MTFFNVKILIPFLLPFYLVGIIPVIVPILVVLGICKDAIIENCNIQSPFQPVKAPSTDGIDLDVCKDIIIKGCYIAVNDDAIVMKGGKGPNAHNLPENGEVMM